MIALELTLLQLSIMSIIITIQKNRILDIISLSSAPSFLIMTTVIQRHSREAQVMITDF